jgi:DNA-binding LytR/AlgR family response regulator
VRPIKAIIADYDESLMSELESLLARVWPDLVICGRATSGPEALELIDKHKPHLAFLEVRIPGICGMQVARRIGETCHVVFITAYDHYAVNAFESGAIDYLVKPVSHDRLQKATVRLKRQLAASSLPTVNVAQAVEHLIGALQRNGKKEFLHWIRVQHRDGLRLIPVEDVCFFQADNKYTRVVTKESESLIKKPIKELVCELDPHKYWRIHRGTIVNVAQIDKVSRSTTGRGTIRLKDRPESLVISRSYLHIFKQM